jgi:hypothetical protein
VADEALRTAFFNCFFLGQSGQKRPETCWQR